MNTPIKMDEWVKFWHDGTLEEGEILNRHWNGLELISYAIQIGSVWNPSKIVIVLPQQIEWS